jgi:hypothetical protein
MEPKTTAPGSLLLLLKAGRWGFRMRMVCFWLMKSLACSGGLHADVRKIPVTPKSW